MVRHFLKTLIVFLGMIILGLIGVFLVNYFDKAEGETPELPGEVAIAYLPAEASVKAGSKDGTITPREIYNFQKTHKGILNILGGIFDGKFISKEKMMEIAMIPSREVLYAQFLNLINSPIQRFAVVLNEIAKSKS